MKPPRGEDLGLRCLHTEPRGSDVILHSIQRTTMQRIERPSSRVRALLFATPARIAGFFLVSGLAVGASTAFWLDHFGVSVVHSDGQEYVQVDGPSGSGRALLPVDAGQGADLAGRLASGSRLLTLDGAANERTPPAAESNAQEPAQTRGSRTFRVDSRSANSGALLRTTDGREVRVQLSEDDSQ